MGYLHIQNLYRDPRIFKFDEVYAMEKIHGTSAHLTFKAPDSLTYYSGGESYENFKVLFDGAFLVKAFASFGISEITVYGEAYGGKQQGMRDTYGDSLKFVVFDVKFNDTWLAVPDAETVAKYLKLEFVHYTIVPTKLLDIDQQRDADSVQAIRNGMGEGKKREGIVLRPFNEEVDEFGERVITKHKRDDFRETKTVREVSKDKLAILTEASKIAEEWVTERRLEHVLNAARSMLNAVKGLSGDYKEFDIKDTPIIMEIMLEDIKREAKGEILESREAVKAIGSATARLFKKYLTDKIKEVSQ